MLTPTRYTLCVRVVECNYIYAWQVAESQGRDQKKASVVLCAEAESSTGAVQSMNLP